MIVIVGILLSNINFTYAQNDSLWKLSSSFLQPVVRTWNVGILNGNFGIGTSSPYAKLSVVGEIVGEKLTATSTTATTTLKGALDVSGYALFRSNVKAEVNLSNTGNLTVGGTLGVTGATTLASTLNVTGQTTLGYASTTALTSTGSAYFATSGGNVGIGTTSPYARLSVEQGSEENVFVVGDQGTSTPSFVVKGNGNVGIGTTSPSAKLAISGDTNSVSPSLYVKSLTNNNYAALIQAGGATGGGLLINAGTNNVNNTLLNVGLYDGTSRFIVQGGGNVGIGTTTPTQKLEIQIPDATGLNGIRIGTLSNYYYDLGRDGATGYFKFYGSQTGGYIFDGATGEKMRITSTGNVGIGTTTPVNKLTVAGDEGFYGTIPTISSCGSSPVITTGSTATAGEVTEGTIATGCVITFAVAKTNAPFCTVSSKAGLVFTYAVSNTAITITNVGDLSSTAIVYRCTQNNL